MSSILIADRDDTERKGIRWLIQSYPNKFEVFYEASNVGELIHLVENKKPQVVCLELEMVPADYMLELQTLFINNGQTIICTTAEAIFERAVQAMDLFSVSLLIKPVSPEQLKRNLLHASQKTWMDTEVPKEETHFLSNFSHESFFIQTSSEVEDYALFLIRPENPIMLHSLFEWVQDFSFSYFSCRFALQEQVACLLKFPRENRHELLQHEGNRLLHWWGQVFSNYRINLAVHPGSDHNEGLQHMYQETNELFQRSFFKGYHQIFWAHTSDAFYTIDPFLTPEEQRDWMEMLEGGEIEKIKSWMYQSFQHSSPPFPDPELLRIRLTSILAQIRRFMYTYKLNIDQEYELAYHNVFQTIIHQQVLFPIVQEMILFIIKTINGAKHKVFRSTDNVARAISYLKSHYLQQGLKLKDVAESIEISPSYLSVLFTENYGRSFREVLSDIRLNESKRLLKETNQTIKEITEEIGYSDANYFSRLFHKKEGLPPRQFRRQFSIKHNKK
ncbi:helix-turn-helix domain-containing protein [Thalassobacillus sp. CUG 92003]|uniref:helix-turn-helix domain-containing protein n=1 Tax=Thalassobacillus sp. CUG 92003 TaxID=2736641 RepID=UPI0015E6C247|nr:helix-turn-helix domain-containing protein [Thalassobacillus sp. CUG 92003]